MSSRDKSETVGESSADESMNRTEDEEELVEDFDISKPESSKKRKTSKKPLKRDIVFEEKKKVASEVAKYKHLFDITNAQYSDRALQKTTRKKVSEQVGLPSDKCIKHWESLKSSASYHAKPTRDPYKSGAAADSEEVQKKYKEEWQFADIMSFYTPPALKKAEKLVSIWNQPGASSSKASSDIDMNESLSSAALTDDLDETESVYVSILLLFFSLFLHSCSSKLIGFTFNYFRIAHRKKNQKHQNNKMFLFVYLR